MLFIREHSQIENLEAETANVQQLLQYSYVLNILFSIDPSLGVSDLMLSQAREHYQTSSNQAPDNIDLYRQPIHVG
jgi:hypothetical protein